MRIKNTKFIKKIISGATSIALLSISIVPATLAVATPVHAVKKIEITTEVDKQLADRGDVLSYTITVKNTGDEELSNTTIWTAPLNLATVVSGSGSYTRTATDETKDLPDNFVDTGGNFVKLPADESIIIKFQTKVAQNANNDDILWLVAGAKADKVSTVEDRVWTRILLGNPHLCASKSADVKTVSPGDVINYTIEVCNDGNVRLHNVKLFDEMPNEVTFVKGSASYTRGDFNTDITNAWVTDGVNLGELNPGRKAFFKFQVKVKGNVKNGEVIRNAAKLTADEFDKWIECENKIKVKFGKEPKVLSEVKQLPDTGPGLILLLAAATVPAGVFIKRLKTKI